MKNDFLKTHANKALLFANVALSIFYFALLAFFFQPGNKVVYGLLIAGEIFHLWQVFGYIHTSWGLTKKPSHQFDPGVTDPVAIFITVCGEPRDIVATTVKAATEINYPQFNVYILNDGRVANRDNWKDAEKVAKEYGITCITRTVPGGAKAGNINNGLKQTTEPFFVVLDADHVPKPNFLRKTMGYFADEKVAFVQTPQYYHNHARNQVTTGAWDQQALFFGAIMKGKDAYNAAFMCGTNMVLRRTAIMEVGGMCEDNIAEDFLTSLQVHNKGWKSRYVPEVLAEGLAPEDFLSYYKQQFRWARGSLEVIFGQNPLFKRGLSWGQRFEYLSSASYYLSGSVVALNALLPLIFLYFGLIPLRVSTMALALAFIPYIMMVLYNLQYTSNATYTFKALSFSLSSFTLQLKALLGVITRKKATFAVTSKKRLDGTHTRLVAPHITYIVLVAVGAVIAYIREGLSAALVANLAWGLLYVAIFMPFIMAAREKELPEEQASSAVDKLALRHVAHAPQAVAAGMEER